MHLPDYFARRLVVSHAEKSRMSQLTEFRPLNEACLNDDRRSHPMRAQVRESDGFGERRLRNFQRVQPHTQFQQQLGVESCAKLAGINQIVVLEVSDQKGAEPFSRPLWVGKAADHKLLR